MPASRHRISHNRLYADVRVDIGVDERVVVHCENAVHTQKAEILLKGYFHPRACHSYYRKFVSVDVYVVVRGRYDWKDEESLRNKFSYPLAESLNFEDGAVRTPAVSSVRKRYSLTGILKQTSTKKLHIG